VATARADEARDFRLAAVVSEWLLDLQVMGRSERTLTWYREKMDGFIKQSGARTLADLTALALKQRMADEQGRGLGRPDAARKIAPTRATIHSPSRESLLTILVATYVGGDAPARADQSPPRRRLISLRAAMTENPAAHFGARDGDS
jgi:hypothetical protein